LLFWAVGAYNRLVRLRAGVAQAFAGIAAHGARLLALLEEFGAANPVGEAMPAPAAAATGPRALWRQRWEEEQMQSSASVQQFHTAVQHYNAAMAQFPALLLAWLFGFKAARALEWHLSQGKP